MRTKLLLVLATCTMLQMPSGYAAPETFTVTTPEQMSRNKAVLSLPLPLQRFLNSEAGRGYNPADFARYLDENNAIKHVAEKPAETPAPEMVTVLTEDFSKWTAGSEGAPDDLDLSTIDSLALQEYMQTPGWECFRAFQAGGMAYLGYDEVDGPGTLYTPVLDLAATGGMYKLKFRARSANPMQETQALQTWTLDDENMTICNADAYMVTTEWTDCEIELSGGGKQSRVLMHGMSGMVYFDDFELIVYDYGIARPVLYSATLVDAGKIQAIWSRVDAATSYKVALYDSDNGMYVVEEYDTQSTDTTCIIDFTPVPGTYYRVEVKATDGTHLSPAAMLPGYISPVELAVPVASEAAEVTEGSFLAQWEAVPMAYGYEVMVTRHHIAQADGEEVVLTDENFDSTPPSADGAPVNIVQFGYCDEYFNQPGWLTDIGFGGLEDEGVFGITNIMADWGAPGIWVSPSFDFSKGGGNVNISFKVRSWQDDAVLIVSLVDYETATIVEGYKALSVSTEWQEYSFTLSNGIKDGEIYFAIYDAAPTEIIWFDDLKVTQTLSKGEEVSIPYRKEKIEDGAATSVLIETPDKTAGDYYVYNVSAYYPLSTGGTLYSPASQNITVGAPDAVTAIGADLPVKAYCSGDELRVINPACEPVAVYSVSGMLVAADRSGNAEVAIRLATRGVYVVRVGDKAIKVVR